MRKLYREVQRRAAEMGLLPSLDLTPKELALFFAAHRARREQKAQQLLLLARYAALAVHAPDRLPPPPSPDPHRPMTADEMKQRLLAWRGKDASP